MRKPRGVQIRANRLIGPGKCLVGTIDELPAKGRGRTAPYRGRSGASWIWSTPLDAGASEGEFQLSLREFHLSLITSRTLSGPSHPQPRAEADC